MMLRRRPTIFIVVLVLAIGSFFFLFVLHDMGVVVIKRDQYGAILNVCYMVAMSPMLLETGD